MKKKLINSFFILFLFIAILFCNDKVLAADLMLNDLKFEIIVNEDASMNVTEIWDIYVSNTNTLYKTFLYNEHKFSDITDVVVTNLETGQKLTNINKYMYHVDKDCYFGLDNHNGEFEIAWGVGLDNSSDTRKYKIEYKVKDAIALHGDCAELYWQIIGNSFQIPIENIEGTIVLPGDINKQDIRVWGHTETLNGIINATDYGNIEFKLENIPSNNMVEIRSTFPKDNIISSGRTDNENVIESIIDEETKWANEANEKRKEKRKNDRNIFIGAIVIVSFIIILQLKYIIKILRKIDKKIVPTIDLDYYRDLPREDATPAQAYMLVNKYSDGTYLDLGQVFSATLMNLNIKKYLNFEVLRENNEEEIIIKLTENTNVDNLSEDEIYETIIALRIDEKTDNRYTIRDLYSNNDNIWQKIFENNIDIRTYTNDFSIYKCVAEDIDKDLLIEQIGMPNEALSFEYLKNKAAPNIYLSKMIAEEYCKSNNIEDNRVKRMIMYAVLSNKQLDYVAKGLTNIIDNLLQSGFNKEQINEIIINSAFGEALQFNGKSYSYSTFINNSDGILNKISSENNINLLGKVNLKKLENYYENIEYSQMSLFSYKTNQMETIFISQEEQENIYTELEDLGLNREFIEEKEIRNVYCTRWAVKTYCDKNNITDKDVIGALIFSILDRKVLNKDRTQYLHTLINNLSSMQLEEEELCALIINLGVTNSSMIADVGGYSFNSLLGNSNNCIEKLGDFFGDLRLEVEDKTITMALERFKESALKEVIEKSKNLDETEVEALKDHLSQIGISDEVMKGKSSRNIYISNWIVEQYCDKHEIADIKIKKMFTLAVLDVDSLNESTTYISTLLEKMKIEGLEDDDICGIILNLAGNSMARKTNGISYIGLLQAPNTVADVLKDNNLPSEISEINMATFISESLDEEEKEKMYEKLNELEILKEIQKEKSDNNLYIALWILEKYCSNHDISDNKTKNKILTKILKNKSLNEGGYMTLSTILQSFERIEWNQDEIVEMLVECTKTGKIIIDDNKFTYSQLLRTPYKISESIKGMEHIFSGIERKIDGKDIMEASMELLAKGRGGSQICDDVQADYMRLLDEKTNNNQKEGSEQGESD